MTEEQHPLMAFEPIVFESLAQWLDRWSDAKSVAELTGLLNSLLKASVGWWQLPELVILLLKVADGYENEGNFSAPSTDWSWSYHKEISVNRKTVAEKAFSVLCLKFFKGAQPSDREPCWWWMLWNEDLFKRVLWFLRMDDGSLHNYHNYFYDEASREQQQGLFRAFLLSFAKLGWEFSPRRYAYHDDGANELAQSRLISARPQLIDILNELGALSWLNFQELDEASVTKLTAMALSGTLTLPPEEVFNSSSCRKPKDLSEAVLGDSVPAQVVALHEIKERARRRIKIRFDGSKRVHDERHRQDEIARLEQARAEIAQQAKALGVNLRKK